MNKRLLSTCTVILVLLFAVIPALADAPTEGRGGRAEVRFLQGMIDHHQMAVDMANHCLEHASTDEVRAICSAVIAAQAPEIAQMQGWLTDWYGIAYTPMSMLGAGDHAEHAASGTDAAMGGMEMGMDMPMMDMGAMQGMMSQMHSMMMMMQMQQMMMQMHGMMQGMMGGGMQGMENMQGMGMMDGMQGMMENMQGMMGGMMGGMGQSGGSQGEHDQHHPEGSDPAQEDHSEHSGDAAAQTDHSEHANAGMATDPSMTMGMMAGLDRAEGIDYDITWLEAMIDHHDDAIHMAERILEVSEHAALNALARAIIRAQSAEVTEMEALIVTLSN